MMTQNVSSETDHPQPVRFRHTCDVYNAPLFWQWIQQRGGVAVWRSLNLSNPAQTWSTPALDKHGQPTSKPHWAAEARPCAVYTDPAEIGVVTYAERKRFRVAIRPGGGGFKLTDASSRKLERALQAVGEGATYAFDYAAQECIILAPEQAVSLLKWARQNLEERPYEQIC
jgi:hypothetical protein